MKYIKTVLTVTTIILSTSVNAALIDNGTYTTDDITGLNWLDLSITGNMTMSEALDSQSGWRFATNTEIVNLFNTIFDGYYDNTIDGKSDTDPSLSPPYDPVFTAPYAGHVEDATLFNDLFGPVRTQVFSSDLFVYGTWGFYIDDSGIQRIIGTYIQTESTHPSRYIIDGLNNDLQFHSDFNAIATGTFLVQSSVVPIPAPVWLFGSGLISLIALANKKKPNQST